MKTKFLGIAAGTILALGVSSQPAQSAVVTDSAIETFLGLTPGSLDGLGPQDATVGSAIKQHVVSSPGGDFTFSWNFLTDEIAESDEVFDLAFYSVDGVATFLEDASPAAGVPLPPFSGSSTIFVHETGFFGSATVALAPGDHTIGFGVLHTDDDVVPSGLLIDTIMLPGVMNGGFESGDFSGWETIGVTFVETAAFGAGPDTGTFQAFLDADESFVVPIPPAIIFLGTGIATLMFRRKAG